VPTKPAIPVATRIATAEPTRTFTPIAPTSTVAPPSLPGGYVCDGGVACIKGNINSSGERIYHFPGCGTECVNRLRQLGREFRVES
jgi:hypothetical protein